MECIREIKRHLYQIEIELTKLKQELNDERQARERAEALVKEVAANGQKSIAEATQKLISTEAELEAIRRLIEEERERFNTTQSETSERQKEAVVAQKTSLQELDKERQSRALAEVYAREVAAKAHEEVVEAMKQASLSIQKLSAAEAELEATRRALVEEREHCEQIKSEASEKQREAVVAQQTSFQEMASAREAASKAQQEIAEATENARRATEKLSAIEVQLEASRQALDEERERCRGIQSQASEKLEETLLAQKMSLKELEDERQARACVEASLKGAADKAGDEVAEAVKKLNAAEAELEATRLALVEEREHCQQIQYDISEKQNEMLLAQKIRFQELEDEIQARTLAEASSREAAVKAQGDRDEAVKQANLTAKLLSAVEAELEASRRVLAEERECCEQIKSEAMENARRATEKLGAVEFELEASRRALDEERERCKQIQFQASEKLEEALLAQKMISKELEDDRQARACVEASLREAADKARDEVAEAVKQSMLTTQKLNAAALVEEREHYQRIQSDISEKQNEIILAQKIRLQELEDESQARALAEASAREATAKAQKERNEAIKQENLTTKLLSAVEAELEATCQALAEEREHSKKIQSEASKRQNELLHCLENDIIELNDERKSRICAEKCAREAAAKAQDEIAEAVRQSSLATKKLVVVEAELESTRQTLAEERQRYQQIQFEACAKQKEAFLAQ